VKSVLDLISIIKRLTDLPFELAVTHGHHDHTSAIAEFDHFYMHPGDRYLIPPYEGTIVDIEPGYRFDLGDRSIEVVDLICHTPGSIRFLAPLNPSLHAPHDPIVAVIARLRLTFDPHIATFEGQSILFNPANLSAAPGYTKRLLDECSLSRATAAAGICDDGDWKEIVNL
jgi:hypothetical protein